MLTKISAADRVNFLNTFATAVHHLYFNRDWVENECDKMKTGCLKKNCKEESDEEKQQHLTPLSGLAYFLVEITYGPKGDYESGYVGGLLSPFAMYAYQCLLQLFMCMMGVLFPKLRLWESLSLSCLFDICTQRSVSFLCVYVVG